jgi:hypothetical protein
MMVTFLHKTFFLQRVATREAAAREEAVAVAAGTAPTGAETDSRTTKEEAAARNIKISHTVK